MNLLKKTIDYMERRRIIVEDELYELVLGENGFVVTVRYDLIFDETIRQFCPVSRITR